MTMSLTLCFVGSWSPPQLRPLGTVLAIALQSRCVLGRALRVPSFSEARTTADWTVLSGLLPFEAKRDHH